MPRTAAVVPAHGAAQCGICTPGMLVSAAALLRVTPAPTEQQVMDALGGVLCRCTGYRKIVAAVMDAQAADLDGAAAAGRQGGGSSRASASTACARWTARTSSAPTSRPRSARDPGRALAVPSRPLRLGDLDAFVAASPGVVAVMTASDIPGRNVFGVIPATADQPVFAEPDGEVRFRGEAVAMVVGEPEAMAALDLAAFPVTWEELAPVMSIDDAHGPGAPRLHDARDGNVLIRGNVRRGDLDEAFAAARRSRSRASSRPDSSSTPTSSRRPGSARTRRRPGRGAGDDAVPAHGPDRARGDPGPARGRRSASSRPRSAEGSAASSTCRCSPTWRSRRGSSAGPSASPTRDPSR